MSIPDGFKVSELGVIPQDWDVYYLGDKTVKIGSGITPTGGSRIYKTEGRPFLRSQNIGWGTLSLDDVAYIDDIIHDTFKSTEIKEGDVFLNITGASIGRSAIADHRVVNGNVNQHVCIIRPIEEELNSYFLNCFLLSHKGQKQIDSFQSGGNRQGLNYGQIKLFKIPLPPLAEQKAIAQSLSDVDNLITAIDKLITKKRNIKQGTMQELLTGKKRLPGFSGEWEVKIFEKVLRVIDGDRGDNYPSNDELLNNGYCLFLSAKNVTKEGFKFSECIFITKEKNDLLGKGKLVKKDLVLTTRGTVGNVAFFDDSVPFENIRINSGMVIIRNEDRNLNNIYLYSFLKSNFFQYQVDRVVFGSAQPQLTVKVISKFEIPIPPLPEQKAIAKILTEMDKEIEALEKKREKYKNIKQGMMQELLTGKTRIIDNFKDPRLL